MASVESAAAVDAGAVVVIVVAVVAVGAVTTAVTTAVTSAVTAVVTTDRMTVEMIDEMTVAETTPAGDVDAETAAVMIEGTSAPRVARRLPPRRRRWRPRPKQLTAAASAAASAERQLRPHVKRERPSR